MSTKRFLQVLILLHLLFYLLALIIGGTHSADSYDYLYQAENLRNSGSFYAWSMEEPIKPDYFTKRTPGYGVFLYVTQSAEWFVLLLQNLISIFLWLTVYKLLLGFRLEAKTAAWLVLGVLIFQSNTLIYTNSILAETLFQGLLFLGFYFLYRDLKYHENWNWLLGGFSFTLALLVKPVLLFFWIPLLAYSLVRAFQRNRFQIIWPVFLLPLTVLLWSTHNQNTTGWTHFTSTSTVNLKDYNTRLMLESVYGADSADVIIAEINRTADFIPDYGHRNRFISDTCKSILEANKLAYARVHVKGMLAMMADPGYTDYLRFFKLEAADTLKKQSILTLFFFFLNLIGAVALLILALNGLRLIRREGMLIILLAGFIAYFWVLTGPVGNARYKSTVLPYMVILAGLGIREFERKKLDSGKSSLPTGMIILSVSLLCCNPAVQEKSVRNDQPEQPAVFRKNPGIFMDTMELNPPSAVFFYPDSLQLAGYKAFIPESFESSEHEYLSQINNARNVLKGNWQHVEILDCKNAKFLVPHDDAEKVLLLNLDEINEPWGLILFEKGKKPANIDMMNIDTELENYFNREHDR